ncbi:uncharacterized protein LOC127874411 [Dreissena polymorpha]|uniref:EF-hand domain-containing protein n=1 Tax=Dreissena polymorpha TaxID=45954 RepID=A0A9D4L3T8_DREPO|nr:uncharacterized protein LOC127874411 [Dreissena polymorpha]KAH3849971.1 hypothetical protein DPMN_092376 [Dreissena polymorpha]
MKYLLLVASCFCVAYCANTMCWTVDQIADQILLETDHNKDGVLQMSELTDEILTWGVNNASCLTFHAFTTYWVAHYHDHHDTAHRFFSNLDQNGDEHLCLLDIAVQIVTYDNHPTDGQVQPAEFKAFLHAVHPDSHQNGGHGHGCQ